MNEICCANNGKVLYGEHEQTEVVPSRQRASRLARTCLRVQGWCASHARQRPPCSASEQCAKGHCPAWPTRSAMAARRRTWQGQPYFSCLSVLLQTKASPTLPSAPAPKKLCCNLHRCDEQRPSVELRAVRGSSHELLQRRVRLQHSCKRLRALSCVHAHAVALQAGRSAVRVSVTRTRALLRVGRRVLEGLQRRVDQQSLREPAKAILRYPTAAQAGLNVSEWQGAGESRSRLSLQSAQRGIHCQRIGQLDDARGFQMRKVEAAWQHHESDQQHSSVSFRHQLHLTLRSEVFTASAPASHPQSIGS